MAGYISTDSDGNLDDDDIDAILGLGTNNSQQQRLKLQMQLANALRTNSNDDPKGTMAGQVYIPPDPFAKGLSVYDHLKGIKDTNSRRQRQLIGPSTPNRHEFVCPEIEGIKSKWCP
jgi:hypothetical protein